eukprot:gene26353-32925_t
MGVAHAPQNHHPQGWAPAKPRPMTSLIHCSKLMPQGRGLARVLIQRATTITLDWDTRQKSRFDATDSQGRALGVFLPRGTVVRGGDVLVAEDGSLVRVEAAPQAVLRITACSEHGSPFDLTRAAYHLGNRHVPIELQPDHLKIEPDHVLADMLRAMHMTVIETMAGPHTGMGMIMVTVTNRVIRVMHTLPTPSPMCTVPTASTNMRPRQQHRQQASASPSRSAPRLLNRTYMAPAAVMGTETAPSALLQLIWLASPALPIGGFSYSEGLEAAIDQGLVHNEASATDWVVDQLHLTQSRGDMAVVAQAIPAWQRMDTQRLKALNDWVMATRETAEMRLQAEQMGRSLLDWLRNLQQASDAQLQCCAQLPPTYPLAMALALSLAQAPLDQALQAVAFGWAENMTQAALKAVPLGQSAGQRMLARLAREIPQAVQTALHLNDEDRQAFSPMLAILSSPLHHIPHRTKKLPPLRVGIGGPVGSGKTTLLEMLCKNMRERWDLIAITNDIYTKEDQRLLTVSGALPAERIMGVETGGCPHTAIREDASINLEAIDRMLEKFPNADVVFIESGGDNLAATFSPELSDLTIYVIDVAAGEKIPRKGGPGITKSDLFVINKTDLAPHVGADLQVMRDDTQRMRPNPETRPWWWPSSKSAAC